jgi:tetratricopeptide (TPR) repeat protein
LPLFATAVEEADAAKDWDDLGWIYQNWAIALVTVGQLDHARKTYIQSVGARRKAGNPRVVVVGTELEALRVDVLQGRAEEALPAIEQKVCEVREWWARRGMGQPVPEAPDGEMLARTFVGGLDIARSANLRLRRWQACLDILGEIEKMEASLGVSEHERARTRFNTYQPLKMLGKLAEAKAVLEGCLEVFRSNDVTAEASTISALAEVWSALGDLGQAIVFERQALALREHLPNPGNHASSHYNLANYLHAIGSTSEAAVHQLAAIAYRLATDLDPSSSFNQLAVRMREAAIRDERFDLPRLADVLVSPAFATLRAFLDERGVSLAILQSRIDGIVKQLRTVIAVEPEGTSFQNLVAQWPGWAWLLDTLRSSGLEPTSTREVPSAHLPSSWLILAKPSELLRQHFEFQPQVLILCVPSDVIQENDIKRAEKIFSEDLRIDPGFALVITADPTAEQRLAPILPDNRRYLFVRDETFRTAPDPQAFLHALLRDGLGRRRLFDFRLPAGEWQFFGREKELEALERDVLTGHSLGVFGLRKVGKTSLLERMAEKLREGRAGVQRGIPVKVDLQTTSYLRRNFEGVAELIGSALDRELSRAQIQVPAPPSHPLERLRAAVEHIEHALGARVVVILDEYEVLLDARRIPQRDGVELLTWLRGLAQEHPKGFSLVLAGRNQRLVAPARIDGADNPMYRFLRTIPVAGLVPDDCRRMVQALGGRMGLHFEPEALNLFVQETGGHPALVRTLGDLIDVHVPTSERNPAIVDAALVKRILPRFSREVDEDMREFVNAANDFDARAGDYLVCLAHGVPWIGGPSEARIDDALIGYGILDPATHAFRIGRLRTWLRENHQSPVEAAHG